MRTRPVVARRRKFADPAVREPRFQERQYRRPVRCGGAGVPGFDEAAWHDQRHTFGDDIVVDMDEELPKWSLRDAWRWIVGKVRNGTQ